MTKTPDPIDDQEDEAPEPPRLNAAEGKMLVLQTIGELTEKSSEPITFGQLRDGRLSDRERSSLEGEVESLERRIDEAVFKLYGVEGLPLTGLSEPARRIARRQAAEGLLEGPALDAGRAVLTRRGRLLADAVVRDLTD